MSFFVSVTLTAPTTLADTYLYTRSVYNTLGQLTRQTVGTQAPTTYAYDSMGNLIRQTVLPIATRPLAIQKDRTWYCYGWDLTKNSCEIYSTTGYILTYYAYTPYGEVTAIGNTTQPLQWSGEFCDSELGLIYYNFRYYNPVDGRWLGRDLLTVLNPMEYCGSNPVTFIDVLGAWQDGTNAGKNSTKWEGHSNLGHLPGFDYAKEDHGETNPYRQPSLHFMNLNEVEPTLLASAKSCNKDSFESNMHRMQDFFSHFSRGYRWPGTVGHLFAGEEPDNPYTHAELFEQAKIRTAIWEKMWSTCCCCKKDGTWTNRTENEHQCQELTVPPNNYTIIPSPVEKMRETAKEIIQQSNNSVKNSIKENVQRVDDAIRMSPINAKYTSPIFGI